MNEDEFRKLTGNQNEEEPPEEIEARQDRMRQGEGTIEDVFTELPNDLQRHQDHYLSLYGLKAPLSEEVEQHSSAMFALMSEEQKKQYDRAMNAYLKRNLPIRDRDNHLNDLESFAATNPPEVLRRHIWRLQRGLDEPLFGTQLPPRPKKVRQYSASLTVNLCDGCAEELQEETEAAGAQRANTKHGNFYDHNAPGSAWFYKLKYQGMYIDREHGSPFNQFPFGEPKTCDRCGDSDVDLWQDVYGRE